MDHLGLFFGTIAGLGRSLSAWNAPGSSGPVVDSAQGPRVDRVVVGTDPFRIAGDGSWLLAQHARITGLIANLLFPGLPVETADPDLFGIDRHPRPDPVEHWLKQKSSPLGGGAVMAIESMRGAAYLGFETPEAIWQVIGEVCPFAIDLRLHPIRYASEHLLLARTRGFDTKVLESTRVAEWLSFEAAALRFRAPPVRNLGEPGRYAMLCLQAPSDSALRHGRRFAQLSDHLEDLQAWAGGWRRLYVLPHPLCAPGRPALETAIQIPNARIASRNVYGLMLGGEVGCVAALSSSVLHEARSLGLEAWALRPDLGHGFPVRPEYTAVEVRDLAEALAPQVMGQPISARAIEHFPKVRAFFSQVGANPEAFPPEKARPVLEVGSLALADPSLDGAIGYGFSHPEGWGGFWTTEPVACLDFAWPSGRTEPFRITLMAGGFSTDDREDDEIQIWTGGRCVASDRTGAASEDHVPLTFDLQPPTSDDWIQIQIVRRGGYVWSDHHAGSDDTRILRVAISRLIVSDV